MKAEKTPLRYIVQRIMRTILKSETGEKDLQPTFMTVAKGSSLIFPSRQARRSATANVLSCPPAVADCEVRGSSCLAVIIIARSNFAVKRVSCQLPSFFCKKRERQLGVLGGRVFVYSQSFPFLHLDLGKSRK